MSPVPGLRPDPHLGAPWICQVRDTRLEGIWTGLRNFLRPFRGVSKWFLSQYVAIFEWAYNLKRITRAFLRAMMIPCTPEPT